MFASSQPPSEFAETIILEYANKERGLFQRRDVDVVWADLQTVLRSLGQSITSAPAHSLTWPPHPHREGEATSEGNYLLFIITDKKFIHLFSICRRGKPLRVENNRVFDQLDLRCERLIM